MLDKKNKNDFGKPLIGWKAPEFVKQERGKTWYMMAGISVILLIAWGIFTDSITFILVIVLLAGVFFLMRNHEPKEVDVVITNGGILLGNTFYPYEEIQTFWIIFKPPLVRVLNLRINKGLIRDISIQLEGQNPSDIRLVLGGEVPEWKNKTEGLTDILIRVLKL